MSNAPDPNSVLAQKASVVTPALSGWMFQPKGILEFPGVPSGDCYHGALYHDEKSVHDYYVFSSEVRVKDWVFTLSQSTPKYRGQNGNPADPCVWFVVGYHKRMRYVFRGLRMQEGEDPEVYLIAALFEIVGPVFYGNVSKDERGGLAYSRQPLRDPANDPRRLRLVGGLCDMPR